MTWYEFLTLYYKNINKFKLNEFKHTVQGQEPTYTYSINGKGVLGYLAFGIPSNSRVQIKILLDDIVINLFEQQDSTERGGSLSFYTYIGGNMGTTFNEFSSISKIFYNEKILTSNIGHTHGIFFPFIFNKKAEIQINKIAVSYSSLNMIIGYLTRT